MNTKVFRVQLKISKDKLKTFKRKIEKSDISILELADLMSEFLTEKQIGEVFTWEKFKNFGSGFKTIFIHQLKNENTKLSLLENADFMKDFTQLEIENILVQASDFVKMKVIRNETFWQEHPLHVSSIVSIISSLKTENKKQILSQKDFLIEELGLSVFYIFIIVATFEEDEIKLEILDIYYDKMESICEFTWVLSDEGKKEVLWKYQDKLSKDEISEILRTVSPNFFVDFVNNQKSFLIKHDIKVYELIKYRSKEDQVEIVSKLEEMNLNRSEKVLMVATLYQETNENLDNETYPKEYLEIETVLNDTDNNQSTVLLVDLNQDLEWYRGLDDILKIKTTMHMSRQEKMRFHELCEICPKIKISDDLEIGTSTVEEYRYTENWIQELLQNVKEDWTDLQKIAYIDHAIGQKISYAPTFKTEVFDEKGTRALWKIIASGYGVCNGIAQVEKYILDNLGIETEMIFGKGHAFLKVKNTSWITANGEPKKGNAILDPTWNLAAHKYGYVPECFCRSYEEIRKLDIDIEEKDTESHKNDKKLSDATIDLDERTLRQIFASIGLTNEKGQFPIKTLMDKAKRLDTYTTLTETRKLEIQLRAVEAYYPDFASTINETTNILKEISLNQKNQNYQRCIVKRVYERKDPEKRPVLYVYVELPSDGKKFYYADQTQKKFIELPQKEFEEKFACYQMDLEKEGGIPWKQKAEKTKEETAAKVSSNYKNDAKNEMQVE